MPRSSSQPSARAATGDTFWTRLSPTARHASRLGLLLIVALAFYAPVIFGGQQIHGNDSVSWRANANALIEYEEATGETALWAPNVFGGMPAYLIQYGEKIPQIDTLVSATRSFAWPVSHLFVLMLGTYLLTFYLTRKHGPGMFAAVVFGFTTYIPIILAVGHNTKFIALAYAPYILLAFIYALRNPSLLAGLLFAVALALGLRAEHPQITYYVLMVALAWWLVELWHAWREAEWKPFAASTGWLALGTALALLMVAQPYLAIYEYKQFSVRGAGAGGGGGSGSMGWEKAMQWSQGVKELITLMIADAFGGGSPDYWGPKPFTEGPHYVGGVAVALSGLALWRVRKRFVWGLGAGVLATILFAFGRHASWINRPMFELFPFFEAFRAPETWLSISALGIAVLGGVGLGYCLQPRDPRGRDADVSRSLLYAGGATGGLVLLLLVSGSAIFSFESPRETQIIQQIRQRPGLSRSNPQVQRFYQQLDQRKTDRQDKFQSDALRTLLVLGGAMLLLWLYRRERLPAWAASGLVVLIVLIDLWGVDRRYLGDDRFSPRTSLEEEIPTYRVDAFIRDRIREAGGSGHFRVLPLQTPYSQSPMNNAISSYHYESIGGYHGAKLRRYQDFIDHVLRLGDGAPNENALDLMNTRYVVAPEPLPGTTVVYQDEQTGLRVLENPDAVLRGFFVGQTEVVESPEATWQRLRDPSFDPRTTAVLPEALADPVTPIDSASTATATLEKHTPPEIQWAVRTDAPRLFVASEIYYPAGWNAYLNGEPVQIHRVNHLLRGVHVPAGEHTLTMRFEPTSDRYGTWAAGVSTVLVYGGIAGILGLRYRRRETDGDADDTGDDA